MPEYIEEQDEPTDEDQQPTQHPSQPLEIQPDGTWILGKGANRWMPSKNQIGDLRWIVEREVCDELGVPPPDVEDEEKIEFYKRQLALLDLARQAPRCEHVFSDGRCCKAPRVKKGKLCYAHTLMEEKRPQEWDLPPLEDANAVMLWLMDALRGLLEGRISEKTAGLMFYGLQLAMVNARFTTFRDVDFEEMVRKAPGNGRDRRNRAESPTSPESKAKSLPLRTPVRLPSVAQGRLRNTKEESAGDLTAKGAKDAKKEGQSAVTAEVAEKAGEECQEKGKPTKVEGVLEPQDAEVNPGLPPHHAKTPRAGDPGVESAKSLFSGVEAGEGVADNRSVPPPPEPPRKGGQKEVLMIPEEMKHYAGR